MTRNKRALRKGDLVICDRGTPPTGAWRNFHGRTGVVDVPNNLNEVGVLLVGDTTLTWFLSTDLKRIEEKTDV